MWVQVKNNNEKKDIFEFTFDNKKKIKNKNQHSKEGASNRCQWANTNASGSAITTTNTNNWRRQTMTVEI